MSKHKKIRFCDKCQTSIPKGDTYYEYSDYAKERCSKCQKKAMLFRGCIAGVLGALLAVSSYFTATDFAQRVDENTTNISLATKDTKDLERRVFSTFRSIGAWAVKTETRIDALYSSHVKQIHVLQSTIDVLKTELKEVHALQKQLNDDLSAGKLTDTKISAMVASIMQRVNAVNARLELIDRDPQMLIDKLIRPTVGISIRDRKGDHLRGSGVLFRREVIKGKDGKVTYRYYGFTAYHVWAGVLAYKDELERRKNEPDDLKLPDDMRGNLDLSLNPHLLLSYYNGNNNHVDQLIIAEEVYPTKYVKEYKPVADFMVFTFVSDKADIGVAELASDVEVTNALVYGHRVYSTGVSMAGVPSIYAGRVANPRLPDDIGCSFNVFGYFGQSGGPVFDAVTLKIISVNQRIFVHRGFAPVTNVLFGTSLSEMRELWKKGAPKEHLHVLD